MKTNFLLFAIIIATISSCSTSYKTGQTPDDVYYSPARYDYDSVRTERRDNTVYDNSEDREIRRRVYNRRNRRYDDTYERSNYPYGNNNYPYGNNYPPVYTNPKYGTTPNTSQPRKTNLGGYSTTTATDSVSYRSGKPGSTGSTPLRTFGNSNNSSSDNKSGLGSFIKRVFSSDGSYNNGSIYNSNSSSPSRTFNTGSNNANSSNNSNNTNNNKTSTPETKTNSSSVPVRKF
ncbi:MAG: hypothetical protein H0W75_07045 [Chitinophagaceae bacterium]|nr:hypothetical protein [Chitinophagaceae bacterium]